MKSYLFQVVIEEDEFESGEKAFSAFCPALKGCNTWGKTYEEALENIHEAVALYVETLASRGQPVPVDPAGGVVEVAAPSVLVNV